MRNNDERTRNRPRRKRTIMAADSGTGGKGEAGMEGTLRYRYRSGCSLAVR
jgi:hypothetical protein